jgi:hypothetical protein
MLGKTHSRLALVSAVAVVIAACTKEQAKDETPAASAAAAQAGASMDPASVEYTVIFKSRWTKANHPYEYPAPGIVTGPHFSGIIGAAHNESFAIFSEGTLPTLGLEKLSEEGKHTPLDEEIRAAIAAGQALTLFESGPLRELSDSLITTVRVDASYPLVSLVAMIAPSPDWFTGVSKTNLMENEQWITSRTLELNAWDSGGDDGATYKAPDKDNSAKKATTLSR